MIGSIELPRGGHVVDIGGGLGGLVQRLASERPDLALSLVELPETAKRAAARLAQIEGGEKVTVVAYRGQRQLQPPADRCLITRVIATLDDPRASTLLGFAALSLAPGGRVEIIDFEADGTPAAAFGDLLQLARSGGAARSKVQWQQLAGRAGLRIVARRSLPGPYIHLTLEPERPGAQVTARPRTVAVDTEQAVPGPGSKGN
jgi:arminomycin 4-O-methyltransferase/SAM-dependent hydroxylase